MSAPHQPQHLRLGIDPNQGRLANGAEKIIIALGFVPDTATKSEGEIQMNKIPLILTISVFVFASGAHAVGDLSRADPEKPHVSPFKNRGFSKLGG